MKVFDHIEKLLQECPCLIEIRKVSGSMCASVAIVEQALQCLLSATIIKSELFPPGLNELIVLEPQEIIYLSHLPVRMFGLNRIDCKRFVKKPVNPLQART